MNGIRSCSILLQVSSLSITIKLIAFKIRILGYIPSMRNEIDKELANYLTIILEELLIEKSQETSVIDESVKKCLVCQLSKRIPCSWTNLFLFTSFRTGVRFNRPPLRLAARRMFAPIWSTRWHSNTWQSIQIINSSQQHWRYVLIFLIIGYSKGEAHRPRTRSSFITESHRFRVRIRKIQFVNPNACDRVCQDISGEWILSEDLVDEKNRLY